MGGAVDVPGNTTPMAECRSLSFATSSFVSLTPSATVNFYADPAAVHALLTPPAPVPPLISPASRFTLLPLDITTSHVLPFGLYTRCVDPDFIGSTSQPSTLSCSHKKTDKSLLVHLTSSVLERTSEKMRSFGMDELQLHDPAAIWYCLSHPPVDHLEDAQGWSTATRIFEVER